MVVRFWPSSRSWHASRNLEVPLLCHWAQLIHKPDRGPRRKPWASPRAHISSDVTYPGLLHTRSCTTLWDASYRYKYPSLLAQGLFPEPLKTPIWKPLGARYSCATYSWIVRSLQFTDPVTLLDHPHVLNIVTLFYQCEYLWTVADISVLWSYNQAARSGRFQGDCNVRIMQ